MIMSGYKGIYSFGCLCSKFFISRDFLFVEHIFPYKFSSFAFHNSSSSSLAFDIVHDTSVTSAPIPPLSNPVSVHNVDTSISKSPSVFTSNSNSSPILSTSYKIY